MGPNGIVTHTPEAWQTARPVWGGAGWPSGGATSQTVSGRQTGTVNQAIEQP
jgi:hypothetical protein